MQDSYMPNWFDRILTGEFVFDKWGAVASIASASGAAELDYGGRAFVTVLPPC